MNYIIDLDDTLFDCERQIKVPAKKEISETIAAISDLRNISSLGEKEVEAEAIINKYIKNISLFPGIRKWLESLEGKKFLVTRGNKERQELKIAVLGIQDLFDEVIITQNKEFSFQELCKKHSLNPKDVVVIGDKNSDELSIARRLGMHSFNIRPKVVCIGGGTGQPVVLEGLKRYAREITAIVTVADDGGSSGRLRKDLGVLPPGDVRNCLVALAENEELLHKLFKYRFSQGELKGHNFGNLFLAALSNVTGSFEEAIRETSKILEISGRVLPSTNTTSQLCARLKDESVVCGEENVGKSSHIKEVFLDPAVQTTTEVRRAIKSADLIVLGPGSLYTSVIVNLLVEGINHSIQESKAKVLYVSNIFTQPGETTDFNAKNFVAEIDKYLRKPVDAIFMNNKQPPEKDLLRYAKEKKEFVEPDTSLANNRACILDDFLVEQSQVWEEQEWLHHDANKLAQSILKYWRSTVP